MTIRSNVVAKEEKEEQLNSQGMTLQNMNDRIADTAKWRPYRLELLNTVRGICDELRVTWFIEAGTLLGAWRNGKMLPHDDDVDCGIYYPDPPTDATLKELANAIQARLPKPYLTRVITTYCKKIEVYDPTHGHYPLTCRGPDATFHNVTVDLQVFSDSEEDPRCIQALHEHSVGGRIMPKRSNVLPVGSCDYDGLTNLPCPRSVEGFLEETYGYLGEDGAWDEKTKRYVKRSSPVPPAL